MNPHDLISVERDRTGIYIVTLWTIDGIPIDLAGFANVDSAYERADAILEGLQSWTPVFAGTQVTR